MKIDLHCHTKCVKNGDGAKRNVDKERFVEAVSNAGVEIVGITNHDDFDLGQYREFSAAAKGLFEVWPGVELDMQGEHDWHLVVICDPKEADVFHSRIEKLIGETSPNDVSLTVQEVVAALDELDIIYIPHAHGKRSGRKPKDIPDKQKELLLQLTEKPNRIVFEPHHHSLGVLSRHGYRVILGSDVKDWDHYENCDVSDLRFPVSSYAAFCRLVEGDVDVYNDTILNADNGWSIVVVPVEGAKQRSLTLYRGVNIIFGQKGTGKTKLLSAMGVALQNAGAETGFYRAADARRQYNDELVPDWEDCTAANVGSEPCESQFKEMKAWKEEPITQFSSYVDYAQRADASKNRQRLVIADVGRTESFTRQSELEAVVEDKRHLKKATGEIRDIELAEYLSEKDRTALKQGLNSLSEAIERKLRALVAEKYALQLLSFSITSIKTHAEALCGSPSSPDGTGFASLVSNRASLRRACEKVLDNVDGRHKELYESFGEIEGKGEILMETSYLMLEDDKSNAKAFNGSRTKLWEAKKAMRGVLRCVWSQDITEKVQSLNDRLGEAGITSTDAFVGAEKRTVIQTAVNPITYTQYDPSDGELAIIMIRRFLRESHDCYLLDEPERGMGNSYIDENIRPDIIKLADAKKTVVLATHNANLAVRTMPVYSMLTEYHEKVDYVIYQGSPYSDQLVNIDDDSDVRSWAKASMTILEGGEEAFYDRRDMYELHR